MAAGVAFLVSGLSSSAGAEFFDTIQTNDYFQNAPFHSLGYKIPPLNASHIYIKKLNKRNTYKKCSDSGLMLQGFLSTFVSLLYKGLLLC